MTVDNQPFVPIAIGVCGATGKMGRMIIEKLATVKSCRLEATFPSQTFPSQTFSSQNKIEDIKDFCCHSQVIIDFSNSEILEKLLQHALIYKNKLVIGTTNLRPQQINLLQESSKELAILYSPNMSLGANLLAQLSAKASEILGSNYDIEIIDYHHRDKKDAPSGTALMLGETLAKTRNLNFTQTMFSRHHQGKRRTNEIGIASIRGGQLLGEHEVLFLGDHEVITIKHTALSREAFADGAINAAIWINDKEAGLYSMRDIFDV